MGYGRSEHAAPPVGGYRPRGVAPSPLAGGRRVVVWRRCTPPGGRAVLSEVCGRFKSAFFLFRRAAPRNQHPRSRVSSRRLREIYPRLGGSSAAARDEYYGVPPQYAVLQKCCIVISVSCISNVRVVVYCKF